tara:strand:- start:273 stop:455 length:183 start_codon:yes stop_codon:yes gene_type:complete
LVLVVVVVPVEAAMVVLVDGLDLDQFMLDLVVVADHTLEVVLKMDKIVLQDLMVDQAVAV